jgi:putative exosortase-associated protein (TIGR04073 family)
MSIKRNKKVITALFLVTVFFQPIGWAYEKSGDYMYDSFSKLGKGLTNVIISPFEIPCVWSHEIKEKETVGVFYGLPKGILFFGRRLLFGATEIASFIIPSHETLPDICKVIENE